MKKIKINKTNVLKMFRALKKTNSNINNAVGFIDNEYIYYEFETNDGGYYDNNCKQFEISKELMLTPYMSEHVDDFMTNLEETKSEVKNIMRAINDHFEIFINYKNETYNNANFDTLSKDFKQIIENEIDGFIINDLELIFEKDTIKIYATEKLEQNIYNAIKEDDQNVFENFTKFDEYEYADDFEIILRK